MAAGTYNFDIEQGADFRRYLRYEDVNGKAIDLTGCRIYGHIRDFRDDKAPVLMLDTSGNFIRLTEPADGRFMIHIPKVETDKMTWNTGVYDMYCEFPDGYVERIIEGKIQISKTVTRK